MSENSKAGKNLNGFVSISCAELSRLRKVEESAKVLADDIRSEIPQIEHDCPKGTAARIGTSLMDLTAALAETQDKPKIRVDVHRGAVQVLPQTPEALHSYLKLMAAQDEPKNTPRPVAKSPPFCEKCMKCHPLGKCDKTKDPTLQERIIEQNSRHFPPGFSVEPKEPCATCRTCSNWTDFGGWMGCKLDNTSRSFTDRCGNHSSCNPGAKESK